MSSEDELRGFVEQATPGMFAWMSLTRWTNGEFAGHGEDQEGWSPDTWPLP
jgi:hypothetical protein